MTKSFWTSVILSIGLGCSAVSLANSDLSRPLTAEVSVAGQMSLPKFQTLMQQGFKSVIVNRPDQEIGNDVSVSQLRSIAERYQASVIYQPVTNGQVTQQHIEEFAKYYNELPKPILMVCRSGARSTALFNQAKGQGLIHE